MRPHSSAPLLGAGGRVQRNVISLNREGKEAAHFGPMFLLASWSLHYLGCSYCRALESARGWVSKGGSRMYEGS